MRGALSIFLNQLSTTTTVSSTHMKVKSVVNGNDIVITESTVEFEEIVENKDRQFGLANVGMVGQIDIMPLNL